MRVLHLTPAIDRFSGGLGEIAVNLASAQARTGASSEIWTYRTGGVANPTTRRFPLRGPSSFGWSPLALQFVKRCAYQMPCVVHQHGIWTGLSLVTRKLKRTRNIPVVVAPQGSLEPYALRISRFKKRLALLAYESANLREADCLQATCFREAEHYRQFGLKAPIAVIPNAIDEQWLSRPVDRAAFSGRFGFPPGKRVILFLSRLHPKKGVELLLRAFAQAQGYLVDCVLVLAGYGDSGYEDSLRLLCRDLHIDSSVRFVGALADERKREAFGGASLFVLPTLSDNFAIVVCEALGSGVPVITTTEAPWGELVEMDCGWWVEATVEGISTALVQFAKSPETKLLAMGQRGKELVSRKYTWSTVASQCMCLYRWLCFNESKPDFVIT